MARGPYSLGVAAFLAMAVGLAASATTARGDESDWVSGDGYYEPVVLRFGVWGAAVNGSPNKTLEFQGKTSSAFWDVDSLGSDGRRTVDFHATGLDDESNQGSLRYYGPNVSANIDYERFIHRLDRNNLVQFDPLNGLQPTPFRNVTGTATYQNPGNVLTRNRDLQDVGQDYAIRVQEFGAKFKGEITEGVRWRLNVWGIEKQGDRQTIALGHCYSSANPAPPTPVGSSANQSTCHMQSKRQTINWATNEVEPVIETKLGNITIEYSRPMRTFNNGDSDVTRSYNTANHEGWIATNVQVPYADTVNNYTQIDKLKIGAELTDTDHLYAYALNGDTKNEDLNTRRYFSNIDVRLVDESLAGLTLTGYGKRYTQSGQLPTTAPEAGIIQGATGVPPGDPGYEQPIAYQRTTAGVKGRWSPYEAGWAAPHGLSFVTSYEYGVLDRQFADTEFESPASGDLIQEHTVTNTFDFRTKMKWTANLDTYIRYRNRNIDKPLFGTRIGTSDVNTMLPTNENLFEVGGTLVAADNLIFNGTAGVEKKYHESFHANTVSYYGALVEPGVTLPNPRPTKFTEDNYPLTFSVWYAPSERLSLSAGYATFGNWIDQLITLGDQYNDNIYNTSARNYLEANAFQSNWKHQTKSQVVDLGSTFKWTERLSLVNGMQYVWGKDITLVTPPALSFNPLRSVGPTPPAGNVLDVPDWSYITPGSDVIAETWRVTAGVDYQLRPRIGTYFRYNYYQFTDYAGNANNGNGGTGTAHLFLGGMSATY